MNVVVICHWGRSGYNVQRALAALGIKSYFVIDQRATSVRYARGSKVLYHTAGDLSASDEAPVIARINAAHQSKGITSVIAADMVASLFLARIQDRLTAPLFPMASAETLQRLDDKWEFAKICLPLGVDIPKTVYFPNNAALDPMRCPPFPVLVKPAVGYGQRNIVVLPDAAAAATFRSQHSHDHGMVVQEFIKGEDWSLSVFAMNGVVRNWTAWECPSQLSADYGVSRFMVTQFRHHDRLLDMVKTVVAALQFSGIANFDARLSVDGRMVLLECNPRFFNRMLAARIGGNLNFVAAGLPGYPQRPALCDGTYYPWQYAFTKTGLRLLVSGVWPWRFLVRDLYEMLRDPIPPLVRKYTREDSMA